MNARTLSASFRPGRRLDAARHVDRVRAHRGQRHPDVLRREPAREHQERGALAHLARPRPVERAAGAAGEAAGCRPRVEQDAGRVALEAQRVRRGERVVDRHRLDGAPVEPGHLLGRSRCRGAARRRARPRTRSAGPRRAAGPRRRRRAARTAAARGRSPARSRPSTQRGLPGTNTKPIASAPARAAATPSSTVVIPQILTATFEPLRAARPAQRGVDESRMSVSSVACGSAPVIRVSPMRYAS